MITMTFFSTMLCLLCILENKTSVHYPSRLNNKTVVLQFNKEEKSLHVFLDLAIKELSQLCTFWTLSEYII